MKKLKISYIIILFLFITPAISACGAERYAPQQEKVIDKGNNTSVTPNNNTSQKSIPDNKQEASEETVIGSYQTTILDTDSCRVRNIRIAAQEINRYALQPGEIFSFNDVVGRRVPENGYKKAKIIVKGKREEGTGGGVCQLSTTLYNAVENSGLEVVERHSHSKDVHYVPHGRDATVVYGSKDFKFRNSMSYPVQIRARVKNGTVSVSILRIGKL